MSSYVSSIARATLLCHCRRASTTAANARSNGCIHEQIGSSEVNNTVNEPSPGCRSLRGGPRLGCFASRRRHCACRKGLELRVYVVWISYE